MRLSVEFLAQAKLAAGAPARDVVLEDGASARDLLRELSEGDGELARICSPVGGRVALLLFVGETQRSWDDLTPLVSSDRLLITTPMSGG